MPKHALMQRRDDSRLYQQQQQYKAVVPAITYLDPCCVCVPSPPHSGERGHGISEVDRTVVAERAERFSHVLRFSHLSTGLCVFQKSFIIHTAEDVLSDTAGTAAGSAAVAESISRETDDGLRQSTCHMHDDSNESNGQAHHDSPSS